MVFPPTRCLIASPLESNSQSSLGVGGEQQSLTDCIDDTVDWRPAQLVALTARKKEAPHSKIVFASVQLASATDCQGTAWQLQAAAQELQCWQGCEHERMRRTDQA